MVSYLIDHAGVGNVDTPNFAGKTPLEVALRQDHDAIAAVLRAHGAPASRPHRGLDI